MKKLLSAFVILAAVSLFASAAFAATLVPPTQYTPYDVACELFSSTAPTTLGPVQVVYTPGSTTNTSVSAGQNLTLTLAGAAWAAGSGLYIIDAAGNIYNSLGSTSIGNAVQSCVTTKPISFTTGYSIVSYNACGTSDSPPMPSIAVQPPGMQNVVVPPTNASAGDSVTLTITGSGSGAIANVNASTTLFTIVCQFTAYLYPDNTFIDFSTDQTTFVPTEPKPPVPPYDTKDCAYAALLITSNESLAQKVSVSYPGSGSTQGYCGGYLGTSDGLTVTVTGNLQGLDELDYSHYSTTITPGFPPEVQKLKVPGSSLRICQSSATNAANELPNYTTDLALIPLSLCDNWRGTRTWPLGTPIVPGCETAQVSVTGGSSTGNNCLGPPYDIAAGFARSVVPATTTWCLNNNATGFYIPYLDTQTGSNAVYTSCTINNFSQIPSSAWSLSNQTLGPASVSFTVLTSEDGSGTTAPGNSVTMGSIPPNSTALITFMGDTVTLYSDGTNTPMTLQVNQCSTLYGGCPAGTRYSGVVWVESTTLGVDMNCVQTDPACNGGTCEKRSLQLTTNPNFTRSAPASLQ
jgi:hypothetical protein